jgi:tRNA wybutosine-synthesizing protein 1
LLLQCLVLLARKDIYLKGDEWWTWIDYDKFHELSRRHTETGEQFTSADYLAKTPYWAVHGAAEEGFDPAETRVRRYKSTESGCG